MFHMIFFGFLALLIVFIVGILAYEILSENYDKCYGRMEKEELAHNGNCRGMGRECRSCPYYTELPIMKIDEKGDKN